MPSNAVLPAGDERGGAAVGHHAARIETATPLPEVPVPDNVPWLVTVAFSSALTPVCSQISATVPLLVTTPPVTRTTPPLPPDIVPWLVTVDATNPLSTPKTPPEMCAAVSNVGHRPAGIAARPTPTLEALPLAMVPRLITVAALFVATTPLAPPRQSVRRCWYWARCRAGLQGDAGAARAREAAW